MIEGRRRGVGGEMFPSRCRYEKVPGRGVGGKMFARICPRRCDGDQVMGARMCRG